MIPGLDTLLGGALGGVLRFAPELLKWLDRKDDRKHELAMFNLQMQADSQKANQQRDIIQAQGEAAADALDAQALIEALKAQGAPTGIGWVDAVSATVRPFLTYYWAVVLYTAALVARFIYLVGHGGDLVQTILSLWGADEKAIAASMIAYWFADRSLRKGAGLTPAH